MTANNRKSALLGQMAALANFMHVDGIEAFNDLSDTTRDELQSLFNALNDELQQLIAEGRDDL
ncbi:hypothetical protein [Paraburkholderia hospita]|uniref:hypothetical protein n=1 Tax=Paraburkholderia hospita TaxID=169430 RepID=UPI003ECE09AB